jgi:hypothetical protein
MFPGAAARFASSTHGAISEQPQEGIMETKDKPVAREAVDPAGEAEYRRKNFKSRPYDRTGRDHSGHEPSTTQPWHDAEEATKDAWDRVRRP